MNVLGLLNRLDQAKKEGIITPEQRESIRPATREIMRAAGDGDRAKLSADDLKIMKELLPKVGVEFRLRRNGMLQFIATGGEESDRAAEDTIRALQQRISKKK